jgi:multidrug efflux system membrane fusion protein
LFDEMTTGAPASEQTKVKYSAAETASRARTGMASDWRAWLAAALIVLVIGYFWHARRQAAEAAAAAKAVHPGIPVAAVQAKLGDMNRYLTALGAVTPFATVTVKPRVVGQIVKIDFTEGQLVKQGQLIIEIDPRPYQVQLDQYEGQMARDRATLENARITLERYQVLIRQGVIASQDLDNQQAIYQQAQGTVENDQGLIDSARLNLTYCRITSPITGRIGLRLIDLGNYVATTDSLVVITQLQPISAVFAIPEDDIPQVVADMRTESQLPVQAWNRDFTKQIASGFLLTFDNQIDLTTGTVKLRGQFQNPDFALFPNQFVNARLLVNTIRNTVLVPNAAVQKSPQGSFVYVVQADGTVAQRGVTVNGTQGEIASIATGLKAGETVVTDGVDKLQPGSKVNMRLAANTPSDKTTE